MQTSSSEDAARHRAAGWWGDTTLLDLFDRAVAESGARDALVDPPNRADLCAGEPRRLTFAGLDALVDRLGAGLFAAGVRQGDVVVTQLPNVAECVALYFAVARLGAIISPLPVQYDRHELELVASTLAPAVSVCVPVFKDRALVDIHRGVLGRGAAVLPVGSGDDAADLDRAADESVAAAYGDYAKSLAHSADDVVTICWTSGTTGEPKGVPRSHNHWLSINRAFADSIRLPRHDRMLCPFPCVNMAAIGGFLIYWLDRQATLVLHHPFDLPVFLGQLERERIAYTVAPPALLLMLLQNEALLARADLSALRTIASGSAPLAPAMVEGFKQTLGIDVVNMFGSNEGVTLVSDAVDVPDPRERALYFPRFGRVEVPCSNGISASMQTELRDLETGEEILAPGVAGELWVRGPMVFDGYHAAADANAQVFDDRGFFRTGDVFEIAGDDPVPRFYRFVGRCKDIIVRGGMNISPDELDQVLAEHPALAEVATVGYPDAVLGEKVCAVAVPRPGETITLEDVCGFLGSRGVAIFKFPEKLVQAESLPRNANGKVLRRDLEALVRD